MEVHSPPPCKVEGQLPPLPPMFSAPENKDNTIKWHCIYYLAIYVLYT